VSLKFKTLKCISHAPSINYIIVRLSLNKIILKYQYFEVAQS